MANQSRQRASEVQKSGCAALTFTNCDIRSTVIGRHGSELYERSVCKPSAYDDLDARIFKYQRCERAFEERSPQRQCLNMLARLSQSVKAALRITLPPVRLDRVAVTLHRIRCRWRRSPRASPLGCTRNMAHSIQRRQSADMSRSVAQSPTTCCPVKRSMRSESRCEGKGVSCDQIAYVAVVIISRELRFSATISAPH